jgi:tetratricopeptide (TPR) repeat protein
MFMRRLQVLVFTSILLQGLSAAPGWSKATGPGKEQRIADLEKQELLLEDSRNWRGAIDVSMEIVKLDPKNTAAINTIAGLHGNLGEFQEEVAWALKALDIDPQFAPAHINHGNGLAALGRSEEAQAAFEKAAELAPKDPLPIYSLGVLAESQGKFEQALAFYQRSVALNDKFENGYFNMAAMLANLKRFDEATAVLKKLLELNPDAQGAREMLRQIETAAPPKPRGSGEMRE